MERDDKVIRDKKIQLLFDDILLFFPDMMGDVKSIIFVIIQFRALNHL